MESKPSHDALEALDVAPALAGRLALDPPWALRARGSALRCHVVEAGRCLLTVAGEPAPIPLAPGDVVVSRTGHQLGDAPHRPGLSFDGALAAAALASGAASDSAAHCGVTLLSASFPALPGNGAALLEPLPTTIVLRGGASAAGRASGGATGEDADGRAGSGAHPWREASAPLAPALAGRACQALVVSLRACIAALPAPDRRLLAALGDPQVGGVVAAILVRPEERQSIARLARAAHMSRSAFAARFTAAVGQPPLHCQLEQRMRRACSLLHANGSGLKEVAAAVGYGSLPSFSHAFKRWSGIAPGEFRRGAAAWLPPAVVVLGGAEGRGAAHAPLAMPLR